MQTFPKLDKPEHLSSIFFPRQCNVTPLPPGATDIEIEVAQGVRLGCRFHINDAASPNIIFFHGNGETVADYDEIGPLYTQAGMNLLVTEFRGYSWSGGSPTVASMLSDAEQLFTEMLSWLASHTHTGAVFVMGRSLGSVPAIDLASRHGNDIKGLLLESAIANTIPLIQSLGLDLNAHEFSEEDGFQNIEKIKTVESPTFILHGARDEIIAASEAENLQAFSGAKTKEFIVIPGAGHNTMIATGGRLYFSTIKTFLDKVTGITNWRRRRKATNPN